MSVDFFTISFQLQYPWYDMEAFNSRPTALGTEVFPLPLSKGKIVTGQNVFALQVHRNYPSPIMAVFTLAYSIGGSAVTSNTTCRYTKGQAEPSGMVSCFSFVILIIFLC
jgi:hypothetical protein